MQKNSNINLKNMKKINKAMTLKCLWKYEELSRTELAEKTGLSPATITSLCEELLNENMIIEERAGVSSGGRKPIMLKINPCGGYICAVNILTQSITYTLINMDLKKIKEFVVKNSEEIIIQNLFENLVKDIDALLAESNVTIEKLIGIGISIPKEYDNIDRRVLFNTGVSADRVNLDIALSFNYKKPVFIENDINARAIAEYHLGAARYTSGFMYIDVSEQVRAAIVYDGQVAKGPIFQNNDIGHMIIDRNGPRCTCGRKGCLEALASMTAVIKKIMNKSSDNKTVISSAEKTGTIKKIDSDFVIKCANEGDSFIREVINEAVEALCIGILNLSSIFSIHNIVIGGKVKRIKYFADLLRLASNKFGLSEDMGIVVKMATSADESINMGNGAIVLNSFFEDMERW